MHSQEPVTKHRTNRHAGNQLGHSGNWCDAVVSARTMLEKEVLCSHMMDT